MSEYIPDCWVIVRMNYNGEIIDKILSGWFGGYGGSDEWRLSSGIRALTEEDDRYVIINESGSVYYCGKQVERMSGLMSSIYFGWQQQAEDKMKEDASKVYKLEIIEATQCLPLA